MWTMALTVLQREVADFDAAKGWDADTPAEIVIHLAEELGELAREVNKATGYKPGAVDKKAIEDELVDLQYLILKLANAYAIDLDDAWTSMPRRYEQKENRTS